MKKCEGCGFDNDDARVFCQNCGARLETPVAVPVAAGPAQASGPRRPESSYRKRPPAAFLVAALFAKEIIWTAVLAAILAAFVQAIREPDDVPAPVATPNATQASLLAADMLAAADSVYPRTLEITTESANNFIVSRVTSAEADGSSFRARFQRAYVAPETGVCRLGVEQRMFGHPVYLELIVQPLLDGKRMSGEFTGGRIGRLPVPPFLVTAFSRSFEPVLASLDAPAGWISKASAVEISSAGATVRWDGKPPDR